jgi:hypothetical protein
MPGPTDVTGAVVIDSFPGIFTGLNLFRDAGRALQIARELRKRMVLQRFHFEIRLHKLPHAREMYESDARLRAGLPQGAGIDLAIAD